MCSSRGTGLFAIANAEADDSRFHAGGISAGNMLEFSRPFVDAGGKADTASFRLAFAAETASPDAFFFACERVNAPKVDRSALERHANGVSGLSGIVALAGVPSTHRDFLRQLTEAEAIGDDASGFAIDAGNGTVIVVDAETAKSRHGIAAPAGNGLQLAGVIFGVADLADSERLFKANAISYERRDDRILVPPAAGQGATFVFEATT